MWILIIIFLFSFSIYLSIKLGFKNYKLNIKELIKNDKSGLFLALGTKIGVGSIIGTLSSIIIGGFSSVLWIIVFSLISTSLIYYEAKLGNKYKHVINNYSIGGPYFILKYGVKNKILSIIAFMLLILLYSFLFQMVQVNTISNIISNTLLINKFYVFIIVIIMLLLTVNLSIKDATNIMNKTVPIMCFLFICVCLIGIITHIDELINSFNGVIKESFTFKSIFSGAIIGIKRSIFMNEVLIGTTSVSSASDNNNLDLSVKYQILGVYLITIMFTILVTCMLLIYLNNHVLIQDYNLLIVNIFSYNNGYIGAYLAMIIFTLFAFTTLLSGFYILKSNIEYMFKSNCINIISKIIFIIVCSSAVILKNNFIWKYTDIFIFIMIIINSYSIIKLMRK